MKIECPDCCGKGKYIGFLLEKEDPCETCNGSGKIEDPNEIDTEEIEVDFEGEGGFSRDEVYEVWDGTGFLD